jgi:SAM-dependent methyltransferase
MTRAFSWLSPFLANLGDGELAISEMSLHFTHSFPASWRRFARRGLRELPCRARDFLPDLIELVPSRRLPLPPAGLRQKVSRRSDRHEFLEVGKAGSLAIRDALEQSRSSSETYPRWLDFGCGPGRLARHLLQLDVVREFLGVDVDAEAIAWNQDHLKGVYQTIEAEPPTELPSNLFDVVVAVSVFTHLSENSQLRWLREMHRVLRPGGVLIASTHSPGLTFTRPDLTSAQHEELQVRGFLFARGNGSFNEDSAFHSRTYLLDTWGRLMGMLRFENSGMAGYQDLSVWVKW